MAWALNVYVASHITPPQLAANRCYLITDDLRCLNSAISRKFMNTENIKGLRL